MTCKIIVMAVFYKNNQKSNKILYNEDRIMLDVRRGKL